MGANVEVSIENSTTGVLEKIAFTWDDFDELEFGEKVTSVICETADAIVTIKLRDV